MCRFQRHIPTVRLIGMTMRSVTKHQLSGRVRISSTRPTQTLTESAIAAVAPKIPRVPPILRVLATLIMMLHRERVPCSKATQSRRRQQLLPTRTGSVRRVCHLVGVARSRPTLTAYVTVAVVQKTPMTAQEKRARGAMHLGHARTSRRATAAQPSPIRTRPVASLEFGLAIRICRGMDRAIAAAVHPTKKTGAMTARAAATTA